MGDPLEQWSSDVDREWGSVALTPVSVGKSACFKYFQTVTLKKDVDEEFATSSEALTKVKTGDYKVCTLCMGDPSDPNNTLLGCLKKIRVGDASNGNTHLKKAHDDPIKKAREAMEQKDKARMRKRKNSVADDNEQNKTKKLTQGGLGSFLSPRTDTQSKKLKKHQQSCSAKLNSTIQEYVNNSGLPDSTVENPRFRKVIETAIELAPDLKNHKHMGRMKLVDIQQEKFDNFIDMVTKLVSEVRDWYIQKLGHRVGFINVAHDVWDGKRKKLNGLTIFFLHPETLEIYRIPVGLAVPLGGTANALCETSLIGLRRVGVEDEDMHRAVNDNCTTAKKTGRLIIHGGDDEDEAPNGACDMHFCDLYAGLALSLVERKVDGKVVNKWHPFLDLYQKAKKAAKFVCDKKNKRYPQYAKALCNKGGAIMINLPNKTRIAGVLLMIEDCLRSVHALRFYSLQCTNFYHLCLSPAEWQQLAEFHAVMSIAYSLSFHSQSDRPEVGAEMFYRLSTTKVHYENATTFEVVDIEKDWPATTPFKDLPRKKMTIDKNETSYPQMTENSVILVSRFQDSFEEYFGEVNDDRLVAMISNPLFVAFLGDIEVLREEDGKELVERAKQLFKDEMKKVARKVPTANETTEDSSDSETEDDMTPCDPLQAALHRKRLAEKKKKKKKKNTTSSPNATDADDLEEVLMKRLQEYLDQEFDPEHELRMQYKRMGKDTNDIDWKRVKGVSPDILYISFKFDMLEWWKSQGKTKYWDVFVAGLPTMALPAANAFLERIFSTAT
eukprot:scaffold5115_cov146-Skeletonema_menzelii.AAC.6